MLGLFTTFSLLENVPCNMMESNKWHDYANNMTFENIRIINSRLKNADVSNKLNEACNNENSVPSEYTADISSIKSRPHFMNSDFKFSDEDSSFTSVSQARTIFNLKNMQTNIKTHFRENEPSDSSKSVFNNYKEGKYLSDNGLESALSIATDEQESDESFITKVNREKDKYKFINPKESLISSSKPLRLFNKNGKPLTDRMGKPLVDILGQPLVVFDSKERLFSDSKGNQVFNSLGESAIYRTTNLHIPPTDEEPGIPLLDIDKRHILFLYDNKGHPLSDCLGRPLVNASGNLMFGIKSDAEMNINNYKKYALKNMYSKAPLEKFVRRVQIFNSILQPLTDVNGKLLTDAKVICNENGMPICDENGGHLFFKYGAQISTPQVVSTTDNKKSVEVQKTIFCKTQSDSSGDSLLERNLESNFKAKMDVVKEDMFQKEKLLDENCDGKPINQTCQPNNNENQSIAQEHEHTFKTETNTNEQFRTLPSKINSIYNEISKNGLRSSKGCDSVIQIDQMVDTIQTVKKGNDPAKTLLFSISENKESTVSINYKSTENNFSDVVKPKSSLLSHGRDSKEAIVLFDASKKMNMKQSQLNTNLVNNFKGGHYSYNIKHERGNTGKKMYSANFIQYFKNVLNITQSAKNEDRQVYNDYGKPMKDIHGNLLYDKFGIPLTGANGKKLDEKARHAIRVKLRNIPVSPRTEKVADAALKTHALTNNESHDQFGDPCYDKHGRPLYDLFGRLIYDIYGRPLTDAFGRPLIDAIGQPLMDSQGNVLTSVSNRTNAAITDIFGRVLFDKRGRALFDSYGRPKYDIFTNAIYDNCGRPATDGNGNVLYDFLNKPIQPHPKKPLYKNTRAFLPKYIDKILAIPGMHRVLKYSRASLKDAFGGPLFDDFGRPLYNKAGKPLYDKYGRPLYDKDGRPLCDCYGRPLSEEIRQSPDEQTSSVVDSLKLLKLTKESSRWMEIKRSQIQGFKSSNSSVLDDAIIMKVVQPSQKTSTQYTYALTRVTKFSCGRQALEILEAPLSPATANDMHNLPVDNKPLIMVARRRQRVIKKRRLLRHN